MRHIFQFCPLCPFVFSYKYHPDQIPEGNQVSKVNLCVKMLKWQLAVAEKKAKTNVAVQCAAKRQELDGGGTE